MTLGKGPQDITSQIDFILVRFTSCYNAILERSTLHTSFQDVLKDPSKFLNHQKNEQDKEKMGWRNNENVTLQYMFKSEERVKLASQTKEAV